MLTRIARRTAPPDGRRSAAAAEVDVAAGGQLLADHPQRQELVALQAQDRAQPFDVGLAVEAVAAGACGAASSSFWSSR